MTRKHGGRAGEGPEPAREAPDRPVEFTSELGAAPAAPAEMEAPNDPEGYVGPDGLAAPHEQPWEVRESFDDALDRLPIVPEVDVAGQEADVATG